MTAYHFKPGHRHANRKYDDADIELILLKFDEGMSAADIGRIHFNGASAGAINTQIYKARSGRAEKPMRVPNFDGWDFRGMDIV